MKQNLIAILRADSHNLCSNNTRRHIPSGYSVPGGTARDGRVFQRSVIRGRDFAGVGDYDGPLRGRRS